MHRWTYIFWNLVHELDYGPSSRSLNLFVVFTLTFSNSGISPCSLESCSQARPQTYKVVTLRESVRGLHFNFLKCGSSTSSYFYHFLWLIPRSVKRTTDCQDGRDFYFFSLFSNIWLTFPTLSTNRSNHKKLSQSGSTP